MNALERELARFDLEFVLEIVERREEALRRQPRVLSRRPR